MNQKQLEDSIFEAVSDAMGRLALDRHLYPTDNCPGSPSRVKLIQSDPEWRQAYEEVKTFKLDMNLHKSPEFVKQALIDMGD